MGYPSTSRGLGITITVVMILFRLCDWNTRGVVNAFVMRADADDREVDDDDGHDHQHRDEDIQQYLGVIAGVMRRRRGRRRRSRRRRR